MGLQISGSLKSIGRSLGRLATLATFVCLLVLAPTANALANAKYAGIVVDAKTGKVLYSENAHKKRYPASTTKIMTLYVLFEELEAGHLTLNTRMKVSRYASRRPPTKLGLKVGSTLRVKDAIFALITRSANDASTVIAEHISGSEAAFARKMTATARKIGMKNTVFKNPHGLPNSKQYTTAADLALLGRAIQDRFPKYYKYFNTRVYTYHGVRMGNHNKLLGRVRGVDGIKTGYTRASGYNLVTNVERDKRHIVAVVLGGRSGKRRDAQMVRLINRYLPKASRGRRTAPLIMVSNFNFPSKAPALPIAKNPHKPAPSPATLMAYANDDDMLPSAKPYDPIANMLETQSSLRPVVSPTTIARNSQPDVRTITSLLSGPVPMANPIRQAQNPARATVTRVAALETEKTNGGNIIPPDARPSGWHIQISATDSKDKALSILQKARKATGSALSKYDLYTMQVTKKKQTLYRARFTGFETKTAAWNACATLKKAKYSCYAIYQ
ncbi:D-alanyl-D-alanine carboxypeptidase [Polycladidibacter stylochi]|uniref:D-alanyl-D-alanine carboxypeptidase n=1 Tax=Polycladidibacter stylochi TaxID=1807766 RepID=UPI0008326378|nr:D-alanyl-D-alanine carboxypeptidase [Pseudovibrio stylochi]